VKFFLSNSAFLDEVKLYQDRDRPLGRFLPEVHRIINCPAEGFTDAHGVPLPPCIVMEKGESLDHWAARGGDGVDRVTGLQVRVIILMHAAHACIRLVHFVPSRVCPSELRTLHFHRHRDLQFGQTMSHPRWGSSTSQSGSTCAIQSALHSAVLSCVSVFLTCALDALFMFTPCLFTKLKSTERARTK
jgi:hypothetical protein